MDSLKAIMSNERNCGNVLSWKTFTYDFWEHKKRKNNYDNLSRLTSTTLKSSNGIPFLTYFFDASFNCAAS